MSYHLNFVRSDEGGGKWTEQELRNVIPVLEGFTRITEENGTNFGFLPPNGNELWLHYNQGDFWGERIDPEFIPFLVKIADSLGARLIGDENETYLANGSVILDPDQTVKATSKVEKFWRRYGHMIWVPTLALVFGLLLRVLKSQ